MDFRLLKRTLGVLSLMLLTPSLCLAKEGEGGILDPRLDLGLWTIGIFVILLIVLRKYAWGPMLEGLKKRELNIHSALEEAQKAREEAQRLQAQFQQQVTEAQDKVREILETGRRDAERTRDELMAKTRTEIQAERDRLRREIDSARDQALKEIWTQSAQLATLISAKAIRRQITADDHRRLVDEALTELRQTAQG